MYGLQCGIALSAGVIRERAARFKMRNPRHANA